MRLFGERRPRQRFRSKLLNGLQPYLGTLSSGYYCCQMLFTLRSGQSRGVEPSVVLSPFLWLHSHHRNISHPAVIYTWFLTALCGLQQFGEVFTQFRYPPTLSLELICGRRDPIASLQGCRNISSVEAVFGVPRLPGFSGQPLRSQGDRLTLPNGQR